MLRSNSSAKGSTAYLKDSARPFSAQARVPRALVGDHFIPQMYEAVPAKCNSCIARKVACTHLTEIRCGPCDVGGLKCSFNHSVSDEIQFFTGSRSRNAMSSDGESLPYAPPFPLTHALPLAALLRRLQECVVARQNADFAYMAHLRALDQLNQQNDAFILDYINVSMSVDPAYLRTFFVDPEDKEHTDVLIDRALAVKSLPYRQIEYLKKSTTGLLRVNPSRKHTPLNTYTEPIFPKLSLPSTEEILAFAAAADVLAEEPKSPGDANAAASGSSSAPAVEDVGPSASPGARG